MMQFDWTILNWIQDTLSCSFMDVLMPKITMLGDAGGIWLLAAAGLLCSRKYRKYGVFLLAGLASAFLIGNLGMKNIFARPRPCWLNQDIELLIARPSDYSFPSGHTSASVIGAVVLTMADRRFGWGAIPLAILIAFSRMYLYVHFPTDILGGTCLGLVLGYASVWLGNKVIERLNCRRVSSPQ